MSLQIDWSKVKKPEDLTDDQYKILQDRAELPAGFPFRPELVTDPSTPQMAHTGTVRNLTIEELEAELERRRAEQTIPAIGDKGGIVDSEPMDPELEGVPYDQSPWTNPKRRAELARRGLSVDGDKDEMCDRLERSDNDMLTDEDYAPSDDDDSDDEDSDD